MPTVPIGADNHPRQNGLLHSYSHSAGVMPMSRVFQHRRGTPPINWLKTLNGLGELAPRGSRSAPIGTPLRR
jgi:hypothetical protein